MWVVKCGALKNKKIKKDKIITTGKRRAQRTAKARGGCAEKNNI